MRSGIAYLIILLVVFMTATGGSLLTQSGMGWYSGLVLPGFTPPGSVIGMVWTVIYSLSAIAAMLIWNARRRFSNFSAILVLLLLNALLNILWSYVFFVAHELGLAIVEMILLNLVNLVIVYVCWPRQRLAALLFVPYFAWVCFATFLAVRIWQLNS